MTPIELVISKVHGAKRQGKDFICFCPAHEDLDRPSLSIRVDADGRVGLKCFAGCENSAIVAALGLTFADLFPKNTQGGKGVRRQGGSEGKAPFKIVAEYPYTDEAGVELFQCLRLDPKDFRQRHFVPGAPPADKKVFVYKGVSGWWNWSLSGVRLVLYRLPAIVEAIAAGREVWLCEGEKDVAAHVAREVDATCNPMGAGKWKAEYTAQLRGARVCMVIDRDLAGWEHAMKVLKELRDAGVGLRAVLPGDGKDSFDHYAAGRGMDEWEPVDIKDVLSRKRWPSWVAALWEERDRMRKGGSVALEVVDGGGGAEQGQDAHATHRQDVDATAPSLSSPPPGAQPPLFPGFELPADWEDAPKVELTELGNAIRMWRKFGRDLRYCHVFGKWLVWDGLRWVANETGGSPLRQMAIETVRLMSHEFADLPNWDDRKLAKEWALKSESRRVQDSMVLILRDLPGIAVLPDELDCNPWLAGCLNGTLDLVAGELREPRREDLITRSLGCIYDPAAECPTFSAHLAGSVAGPALADYMWRAMGYSLTGSAQDQVFFFLFGPGGGGKGTVMEVMMAAMGSYANVLRTESLMVSSTDRIPNDIAKLKGARAVFVDETDEGRRFNESLLKNLTGGTTITARFMRGEEFNYKPSFKLFISGNYRPDIRGFDSAIERRMRLISFPNSVPIAAQDGSLLSRCVAELPGVLAGMVRGCQDWITFGGLGYPEEIREAVADYKEMSNVVGRFLDESCERDDFDDDMYVGARDLYTAFTTWCKRSNEFAFKEVRFKEKVEGLAIPWKRTNRGKYFMHIRLKDAQTSSEDGS